MSKKILITCFGTRGDVQPFVNLGVYLQAHHSMQVTIVTHPEFEQFIKKEEIAYLPIRRSLLKELQETEAGRKLKRAKPWEAMKLSKSYDGFISVRDIKAAVDAVKPDLVIFTTFPVLADAHALCRQHQPPIPYLFSHTVPFSPTSEFAPPTANVGFSLPFGFLNRFLWKTSEVMAGKIYSDLIPIIHRENGLQDDEDLKVPQLQRIHLAKVPIVSIYSSKLLPKPADYDELEHIVGPLFSELDIKGKTPQEEGYVMPVALAEYIEQAKRDGVPLAYVGIGSMLGTLFDEDEITKILNHISEGAIMAQSELACRVLIHTTTGNPEPGKITYQPPDALKSAFFAIGTSIPHRHLLPHCAFIVTHGGAGSMQAALLAGKPSSAIPCSSMSDQPFWASLLELRKLGPGAFPIAKLNAKRMKTLIVQGMKPGPAVDLYTKNAEALRYQLRNEENGLESFTNLIKKQLNMAITNAV